jgi:hypothetical protein
MKRGYDPEDPEDFKKALDLYQKNIYSPVLPADLSSDRYICQISAFLFPEELQACLDEIKS